MRRIHLLNAGLLVALFAGSLWLWPVLPDRIPGHIGFGGEVTRWEAPTLLRWLLLPFVALGLTTMNYGFAALTPRWPGLINLPEKHQFLELEPDRQLVVLELFRQFLYEMSAVLIVLMAVHQIVRYRTAVGGDVTGYALAILILSALLTPVVLLIWLVPIQREVRRQIREQRERELGAMGPRS